jgi:hypothetical protein
MANWHKTLLISFVFSMVMMANVSAQADDSSIITVKKTKDFSLTGLGDAAAWKTTSFIKLQKKLTTGVNYTTQFKILYSDSGIYCLYICEDSLITSTLKEDFADLYNEDVVEAFFWPDEKSVIYFEYELSPWNYELPILVPNYNGKFLGWRPWHYEKERRTRHAASINKQAGKVMGWTAEFFIPYVLLSPLENVPPKAGTKWRANFYRIDYDKGGNYWSWKPTGLSFHEYKKFGTIIFE